MLIMDEDPIITMLLSNTYMKIQTFCIRRTEYSLFLPGKKLGSCKSNLIGNIIMNTYYIPGFVMSVYN